MLDSAFELIAVTGRVLLVLLVLHGLYWVICRVQRRKYDGRSNVIVFYLILIFSMFIANATKSVLV